MTINYTTYDIRRADDVINPRTSHCDIMGVSMREDDSENDSHPFWYARVLGIFHVDVVYTGVGALDYRSRRMEFLWVRWFNITDDVSTGWDPKKLDVVQFFPMNSDDAFGFVDPSCVLRACHMMPVFSKGQRHSGGVSFSQCARDAQDWRSYYVDRFVNPISLG
jgi:hypothetical protein